MASLNELPQRSGATQPAVRTQPAIEHPAAANTLGAYASSTVSSKDPMEDMDIADGIHHYFKLYFSEV